MLADVGTPGAKELKRALALEITVEQRFRILEVIDLVTRELRDEITYSLGDANPKIRRAAFRLAERLKDNAIIEAVLPFIDREDLAVVKGTIRSLAQMGSVTAAKAVANTLSKTQDPELVIVCCQALGQVGDPASVEALVQVLGRQGRFWPRRRPWPDQVRATAALALAQIPHPWAIQALAKFADDSHAQIRQIASSALRAPTDAPGPEAREDSTVPELSQALSQLPADSTDFERDAEKETVEEGAETE